MSGLLRKVFLEGLRIGDKTKRYPVTIFQMYDILQYSKKVNKFLERHNLSESIQFQKVQHVMHVRQPINAYSQ